MKKIILLLITLLTVGSAFSQTAKKEIQKLEDHYTNYFSLNREALFLHLNKTIFLPKEDLWLSAYVYNPITNLPNPETLNLNLDILNVEGVLIETKTIMIGNGKGSGFIDLSNNKYAPGKYFVKASTKYMDNFEENLEYIQSFVILSKDTNPLEEQKKFDLQILPEGGHLLSEVRNNVGVKLIDNNGQGVVFKKGRLINSAGEELITFKSNQFGLSKFSFIPKVNTAYTIEVTNLSDDVVSLNIPPAELIGFNIEGNSVGDQILLSIKTNDRSKDLIHQKIFYAAIHQNGRIKDFSFQFPHDKNEVNLKLSKDSLYSGINTITIFDEKLNPLLERLFFNEQHLKRIRIKSGVVRKLGDSIQINLQSLKKVKSNSLSLSVLPGKTKAYQPNHNILSAFHLKPHLKGNIENPQYYFSNKNSRKIAYDLDILLLTQGWSSYNWNSILSNSTKEIVDHEKGFTIKGTVQGRNNKKENTIYVKSDETGLFEIINIKDDNTFVLKNVYVLDSSTISFGLLNDRNSKISKPSVIAKISPFKISKNIKVDELPKVNFNRDEVSNLDIPLNFIGDAINLDTVNLIQENREKDKYINDMQVIKQEITITEELENRYHFITDYIAANGFKVLQGGYGSLVIENRTPSSLSEEDPPIPQIYFNGMRLGMDTSPLLYLETSQVESIIISPSGIGYGMSGNNGVIEITTRKGRLGGSSRRETIKEIITNNGFSLNKKFYAPKYTSYTSAIFEEYGVIDWTPNLSLDKTGNATFNILNTLQPEVVLFIEGITSDGFLISEQLNIAN
ncbi:hypothetical protein L1I30_09725 [Gillisia sp. M10.2A]|uniref:TonB-dependent receptor plug domain-containing protein n=1 Tax=Gillisia lutea TaxID=2909668 RepID=A0ABS9EGC4_9FLAO|nr:hypothetical protein [Gillisia lutea]MCF4101944.1 hypothetical protein [Gillisia lutea]